MRLLGPWHNVHGLFWCRLQIPDSSVSCQSVSYAYKLSAEKMLAPPRAKKEKKRKPPIGLTSTNSFIQLVYIFSSEVL